MPGARPLAIVGVGVLIEGYDMPRADHTLVARWGKIVAFGPMREVAVPDDAVVIDGHGRVLMSEAPIRTGTKAAVALYDAAVDAHGERELLGVLDGRRWLTQATTGDDWNRELPAELLTEPPPTRPVATSPAAAPVHVAPDPARSDAVWRQMAGPDDQLTVELIRDALHLDRARAVERLRALDPCRSTCCGPLVEQHVDVPREVVLLWLDRLAAHLDADHDAWPAGGQFGGALILLGRHRQLEDAARIEACALRPQHLAQFDAGVACLALHGLEDLYWRLLDRLHAGSLRDLAPHEQQFLAVLLLDGAIGNGGVTHFFDCYSGAFYHAALAGLTAIGAPGHAALLREAGALFGPDGPDPDDDEDMALLLGSYDDEEEASVDWVSIFDPFDDRLPRGERLTPMVYVWAGRNAALFRAYAAREASP